MELLERFPGKHMCLSYEFSHILKYQPVPVCTIPLETHFILIIVQDAERDGIPMNVLLLCETR